MRITLSDVLDSRARRERDLTGPLGFGVMTPARQYVLAHGKPWDQRYLGMTRFNESQDRADYAVMMGMMARRDLTPAQRLTWHPCFGGGA